MIKEITDDGDTRSSSVVWFKFNEGFSDAIKKTVRMKDL